MIKNRTAWIAALAILLQALWPLLSHARPAEKGEVVFLCGIPGETHVLELKTGKQSPLEQRSASHGEHCKLCVFDASKVFTVDSGRWFVPVEVETQQAAPASQAASAAALRLSAHPRAPPAH